MSVQIEVSSVKVFGIFGTHFLYLLLAIQGVEVSTNIQMSFLLQFDFLMLAVCPNRVFIVLMTSFFEFFFRKSYNYYWVKHTMQYLPKEVIVV